MALSKPKLLHQTLPLLSFIALFLMLLANKVQSQDSISFQFDSFHRQPTALTFQGDAHVPANSGFVRLTRTDPSGNPQSASVGRVLFSSSLQFWDDTTLRQASFETTFRFMIRPGRNGAADGIAFFIAPANSIIPGGSSGANLGIFGSGGTSSALFAVEFDTFVNSGWDPVYRHIGIDINNRNSRNVTRFATANGQVVTEMVTAHISYEAATKVISVVANTASQSFDLSYVSNLRTVLPQRVQIGISASTGQGINGNLANFDLHSWYFSSSLVEV